MTDAFSALTKGAPVLFTGIRLYVSPSLAQPSDFIALLPGTAVSTTWDIARAHDLSRGGLFELTAAGAFSYHLPQRSGSS